MKKLLMVLLLGLSFTIRPAFGMVFHPPYTGTNAAANAAAIAQFRAEQNQQFLLRQSAYQKGMLDEQSKELARLEYLFSVTLITVIGTGIYVFFRFKLWKHIVLLEGPPSSQAKPSEHSRLLPTPT